MVREDSKYISEEEREEFQKNIQQHLEPQQDKDSSHDNHNGGNYDGDYSNGYKNNVFIADDNIQVNLVQDAHEQDEFKRAGLQQSKMAKLKGGKFSSDRELDLHGLQVAEAAVVLTKFINAAYGDGHECVKVIHGKGMNNEKLVARRDFEQNTDRRKIAKLKLYVMAWLKENPIVLGFCRSLPQDGGGGATYILLSRS